MPPATWLALRQDHALPLGKAKEGDKNLSVPVAMAGTLVPWQALPQGAASVGNPCGSAGLAGACTPCYGRYWCKEMAGTPFPTLLGLVGEIVGSTRPDGTPLVPEHRSGVSPWQKQQICPAGCPSSLPRMETSIAPLAPALCDGLPQNATWRRDTARDVTATLHAHRQSTG